MIRRLALTLALVTALPLCAHASTTCQKVNYLRAFPFWQMQLDEVPQYAALGEYWADLKASCTGEILKSGVTQEWVDSVWNRFRPMATKSAPILIEIMP